MTLRRLLAINDQNYGRWRDVIRAALLSDMNELTRYQGALVMEYAKQSQQPGE